MIPYRLVLIKKDSSLYGLGIVESCGCCIRRNQRTDSVYCTCFTKFPKLYYFVLKERWLLGIYTVQYNHFIFHGTWITVQNFTIISDSPDLAESTAVKPENINPKNINNVHTLRRIRRERTNRGKSKGPSHHPHVRPVEDF